MAPMPPIRIDLPVDAAATARAVEAIRWRGAPGDHELADALESGRQAVAHVRIPDLAHLPGPEPEGATLPEEYRPDGRYEEGDPQRLAAVANALGWALYSPRPVDEHGRIHLDEDETEGVRVLARRAIANEYDGRTPEALAVAGIETPPGTSSGWGTVTDHGGGQFRVLVDRDTESYPTDRVWWCEAGTLMPERFHGVTFTEEEQTRVRRLVESGTREDVLEAQRLILAKVEDAPTHGATDPSRELAAAYAAEVQDEQAPGLATALDALRSELARSSGPDDLQEVAAAAAELVQVFHRLPVEGWHHLPTLGRPLDLAAVLSRILDQADGDAYLVDAVPARLVVDPGLTVAVSAEEAESVRLAGARVIPDANTVLAEGGPVPGPAPIEVPPTDLPGAGNVARPDAP